MSATTNSTVYVGNLDERVSERVLYDILIQAGRVVDLYIPRDKETEKAKGFAFATYETEEIANYAVRLFTGLVTLYNRTLKFAISGQDKASNGKPPMSSTPASNDPVKPRSLPVAIHGFSVPLRHLDSRSGSSYDGSNFDYGRRVFGTALDDIGCPRSRHFDSGDPVSYPSY